MKTICFNILNGAANQLPQLHQLSDAGAGQDLMHLTPTRDTEMIVYGQALTALPGVAQGNGLLSNGGISPAVLSRGLLQMFYKAGYSIEFNSFNFNVATPQVAPQCKTPISAPHWLSVNHHVGGLNVDCQAIVEQQLLPTLISQSERNCISILAECGVGGTTFSTLWLRLLSGRPLTPAGSTQDRQKLARKAAILAQLEADYRVGGDDFRLASLLENSEFHDQIQRAICGLVRRWPRHLPLPYFAGGMMFVAPLLAARKAGWFDQSVTIATTSWVRKGDGGYMLQHLGEGDRVHSSLTNFNHSTLGCLNVYEQGQVVEGCGLGGTLVLAEQLGWAESDIIAALEHAVHQHLIHFPN